MTLAVSGHGAIIAVEQDPSGAPAVFTPYAELMSDIVWPEMTRVSTEVTPHNDTIAGYVTSAVIKFGPLVFGINYLDDDATHDNLTGGINQIIDNELRGFRIRGPGGGASDDEWILSAKVTNITRTDPVGEGGRAATITVQPTGLMIIDGLVVGTVG